jgi:large subunit ribosomal protein L40e
MLTCLADTPTFHYLNRCEIDENLLCVLCISPLVNPVSASCGCTYCEKCIIEHLQKPNANACSFCRSRLQRVYMPLVTDKPLLDALNMLLVECRACNLQMRREQFEEHTNQCPLQCPLHCGKIISKSTWSYHQKNCSNAVVECSAHDIGCTWKGLRCHKKDHVRCCVTEASRTLLLQLHEENEVIKYEISKKELLARESQRHIDALRERMNYLQLNRFPRYGIFVKSLHRTIVLEVNEEETVATLKEKIAAKDYIPAREIRLIYSGKQLENDRKLKYYRIERDCTVHVALRLLSEINPSVNVLK